MIILIGFLSQHGENVTKWYLSIVGHHKTKKGSESCTKKIILLEKQLINKQEYMNYDPDNEFNLPQMEFFFFDLIEAVLGCRYIEVGSLGKNTGGAAMWNNWYIDYKLVNHPNVIHWYNHNVNRETWWPFK